LDTSGLEGLLETVAILRGDLQEPLLALLLGQGFELIDRLLHHLLPLLRSNLPAAAGPSSRAARASTGAARASTGTARTGTGTARPGTGPAGHRSALSWLAALTRLGATRAARDAGTGRFARGFVFRLIFARLARLDRVADEDLRVEDHLLAFLESLFDFHKLIVAGADQDLPFLGFVAHHDEDFTSSAHLCGADDRLDGNLHDVL